MSIPLFYEPLLPALPAHFTLSEETSKHCVQVLRMQAGELIGVTNGLGLKYDAEIVSADKKQTVVVLGNPVLLARPTPVTSMAISFVKNPARMEWLLEKATETGVSAFYPLLTERTERAHFKAERWESILVSAMLQSQQVWKPLLHAPVSFNELVQQPFNGVKMIAHCEPGNKQPLSGLPKAGSQMILIGPEGDFTIEEIRFAIANECIPVSLGNTRLRTETAGLVAAVLLQYQ